MSSDAFAKRRQAFESVFFAQQDRALLEKVRAMLEKEHPREALRAWTGIQDEKVLDALVALHVNHDTLAAFALYPLVEVAWADGSVSPDERKAFFDAAAQLGIREGSAGHEALREFLQDTPREEARKAWFAWAADLSRQLDAHERVRVRDAILTRARAVAEASGGFLGLGSRVSASEQRVLDRIAEAFAEPR
jgi:uncharacterized tellurite resistance protein B-like protein